MKKIAMAFACALTLLGCRTVPPPVDVVVPASTDLVFVYIHGFGGVKKSPMFCENLRSFLASTDYNCEVWNYEWDSVKIKPGKLGANWLESERRADAEASRYKKAVIDKLEQQKIPYVLIGFSVGSRVVLRALERADGKVRMLRGVYFLGSAMSSDETIKSECLPPNMKIVNYYSPARDQVHQIAFNFMEDVPAGGMVGFKDQDLFENNPVACSHVHKPIGPHIDYSQMADSIGYVVLLRERMYVPGKTSLNFKWEVNESDVWWNRILRMKCRIGKKNCILDIEQQNMNRDYFRAVAEYEDGRRVRVARGDNIHAILDSLKVLPGNYWKRGRK